MELALARRDKVVIRRLMRQRAIHHQNLLMMREACEDLQNGMDIVRYEDQIPTHMDMIFALECEAHLAGLYHYLARYDCAMDSIRRVHVLIQQMKTPRVEAAVVESLQAHIYRWREQPERAAMLAKSAAKAFEHHQRYDSAGRTHFFICEIALDLADRHSEGTLRNHQLALAMDHAEQEGRIARVTMVVGLAHLMQLLWARLNCALACQADYVGPDERVLRASNSPLLAAQAWTVLGRVFGAIGGTASALNAFGNALYVLRGSDMPSQKVWAQRALFGYEQRIGPWWTCATGAV